MIQGIWKGKPKEVKARIEKIRQEQKGTDWLNYWVDKK